MKRKEVILQIVFLTKLSILFVVKCVLTCVKLLEQPEQQYGRSPVWVLQLKKKGFWVGYSALLEKIYCHLPNMDGKLIRPSETTAANRANKWPLACMFPKTRDFHFKLVFELQFHWTVQTNLIWIVRSVDRGYPLPHTLQKLVIIPVCRRIWTAKLLWRYIEFHFRRPSCHEVMSNNNSNLTFVMCTLVRKSDIKTSFCFRLAMDSMKCFDYRSLHHDDFSYGF